MSASRLALFRLRRHRAKNSLAAVAASQEPEMQRFEASSPWRLGSGLMAIAIVGLTVAATARSQPSGAPGSWTAKVPLPVARNEVAAVALNDKIYVLGGSYPRQKYDVADN